MVRNLAEVHAMISDAVAGFTRVFGGLHTVPCRIASLRCSKHLVDFRNDSKPIRAISSKPAMLSVNQRAAAIRSFQSRNIAGSPTISRARHAVGDEQLQCGLASEGEVHMGIPESRDQEFVPAIDNADAWR